MPSLQTAPNPASFDMTDRSRAASERGPDEPSPYRLAQDYRAAQGDCHWDIPTRSRAAGPRATLLLPKRQGAKFPSFY